MGILAEARAGLDRLTPRQAQAELCADPTARLVDLRTTAQRARSQEIPDALVIDLTVLPWRLDPTFDWRIPEAVSWRQRWILVCRHGYSSSLAAWQLRRAGLERATDVIGGYDACVAAGLPTGPGPADERR